MKTIKILDVDFIGGQEGLSKEEEIALSDFFSAKKSATKKLSVKRATRKEKVKV